MALIHTLYAKLAVALLVMAIPLTLLLLWISNFVSEQYAQEVTQRLNQNVAMYVTEQQQLIQDGKINRPAIEELANRMMTINPTVEVYVLDVSGEVISHVLPPETIKRNFVDLEPIAQFLSGDYALPIAGDDPRQLDRQKVFSVSPIVDQGNTVGYLYAVLGGQKFDSLRSMVAGSYILRLGTMAIIGSLLVALLAGAGLFFFLTRRIVRLGNQVEQFEIDQPDTTLLIVPPDKVLDEIDALSNSFYLMASHIQQQFSALQSLDSTRRELVANVSHDLRTPLASMQGYLETLIIKDAELSSETKREYLHIAHKHSQRLNALIGELFELAKLDAGVMEVKFEMFSLTELVFDSVQDFELQAKNKDVRLSVVAADENCFVYADIALIQRVLQNLLDNALRHTPKNQSVTLTISDDEQVAKVEVSDTGSGIAEHEIPHIFERYYMTKQNIPTQEIGSGLGLAIVKRILELHRSTIEVTSELNQGTRFSFDLPLQPA